MSRSYKKTPYTGDKNDAFFKKSFNRKLRRQNKNINLEDEDIEKFSNNSYKKANESWNIKEYGWIQTWEDYWQSCIELWEWGQARGYNEPYPDKEQEYKKWKKTYKRK